jgi:hypothetical protein
MSSTLPRWAAFLGLLAAVFASTVLAQEEIKFDGKWDAGTPGTAVISSDSPSNIGKSPFVPEDRGTNGARAQVPSMPPNGMQPAWVPAQGPLNRQSLLGQRSECGAECDDCPRIGSVLFSGIEAWRSPSDLSFQSNAGVVTGGNLGVPVVGLSDYGVGLQFGGSVGAYNLDGRVPVTGHESEVMQQVYVTAGVFRRAFEGSPISAGLVYDWQYDDSYGALATHPFLGQWRAQIGYALSACNEIGVWGTFRDRRDSQLVNTEVGFASVDERPVSQVNLFWHHNFQSGADSWLWAGVPEHEKVDGEGRLGEYTLGAALNVPITASVGLYATGGYMRPTARAGQLASQEDAYTIGFGLAFYPGRTARTRSVAGNCWMPYLPVANNSNFLVDSGFSFR